MKAEFHFEGEPVAFALPETIPATRQDIFDRVVRHYRKQPRRCASQQGQCQYWIDGGDRCFVGALMSEAEAKEVRPLAIGSLIKEGGAPKWMLRHEDFLMSLQGLHDRRSNWEDGRMPMVLKLFAAEHGLVMPA